MIRLPHGPQPFPMKRIPELDGLRAIAAFSVALYHWPLTQMSGGWLGVDVFFVLSGFLITSLLLAEYTKTETIDFKAFYFRRLLRLLPALVFFLVGLCAYYLLHRNTKFDLKWSVLPVLFYYGNWVRALDWPYSLGLAGHTWSLSIEEHFYFVWPLLLFCLLRVVKSRRGISWFVVAAILLSAGLRGYLFWRSGFADRGYYGSDTRADGLLIGCLVAIVKPTRILARFPRSFPWILVVVGLALLVFGPPYDSPAWYYGGLLAVAVAVALFLVWIQSDSQSVIKSVLRLPWRVWLGQISYAFYLWHMLLMAVVMRFYGRAPFATLLYLGSCVGMAAVSQYLVERPFLRLKDRLWRKEPVNSRSEIVRTSLSHP